MLDTGVEINVITIVLAERVGLAITPNLSLTIIRHRRKRRHFKGIYKDATIQIRGIILYTLIFVVVDADIPLILGQPFIYGTRLLIGKEGDR